MTLFSRECGESNHHFEARYDETRPSYSAEEISEILQIVSYDEVIQVLEALSHRVFVHDVCRYCGKVVPRSSA